MMKREMICKSFAVAGMAVWLAAIMACKTHSPIPVEDVGNAAPEPSATVEHNSLEQADTTIIDTVAVPEKPSDGIYGENSDIPDFVEPPTFPGGLPALMEFLSNNIKYPKEAEKNGVQGRVLVGFIVDVDGAVSESRVEHSSSPQLDREALRVIRLMPAWNPAVDKNTGKPVKVRYHLPVTFKL